MIEKMTKYDFLVFHGEYDAFLDKLRSVGVLHVSEPKDGIQETEELIAKMQLRARVTKCIDDANVLLPKETTPQAHHSMTPDDALAAVAAFEQQQTLIATHQTDLDNLRETARQMEIWGEFDITQLARLSEAGVTVNFRSCPVARFRSDLPNAFEITNTGATVYFVSIGDCPEIESEPVQIADRSINTLRSEIADSEARMTEEKETLRRMAEEHLADYEHLALHIGDLINYDNVLLSTEHAADDAVMCLEGYCPADCEDSLRALLDAEHIYYESHQPAEGDDVPIKLRNSAYTRLFEPIMRLYSLPNYSELDPTPFLAPFFMLFFGLCLGDGGYGALILIACAILRRKYRTNSLAPFLALGEWLGAATLFCGLLTGSFFGVSLDSVSWPWLRSVKHLFLTDANWKDQLGGYSPMMVVAVGIGLIQIFFGMTVNAAKIIKQSGIKYALAPIAWITGLLGGGAYLVLRALGTPLPPALGYTFLALIGISILLILLYNSPDAYRRPVAGLLKNIGSALWSAYNMATGLLGDTLSYIRLFALGLTGSILGSVFNQLAFQFGGMVPAWIGWFVTLFILLFGHTLNLSLNIIGAFVHPLRLTFVEYYKNSGFEGGGREYNPFRTLEK